MKSTVFFTVVLVFSSLQQSEDKQNQLDQQASSFLKMENIDEIVKRRKHKLEHLGMKDGLKSKKHLREVKKNQGVLGEIRQEKGFKKHHHHHVSDWCLISDYCVETGKEEFLDGWFCSQYSDDCKYGVYGQNLFHFCHYGHVT